MSDETTPETPQRRSSRTVRIAQLGLALAIIAALSGMIAGPGYRMGWWSATAGLDFLRWPAPLPPPVCRQALELCTGFAFLGWAGWIGLTAIGVSLLGVVVTQIRRDRRGLVPGIAGIVIGLIVVYFPYHWQQTARSVPLIHDVTTDLAAPPAFEAVPERQPGQNPLAYGGEKVAQQQREGYPDIQPLHSDMGPDTVFSELREAVDDTNWEVADIDPARMRIEATDTTFWFGFQDDIVLRVSPDNSGSRVDMRSQSRIGLSDVGTNARRIKQFLASFRSRLEEEQG